MGRGRGGGGRGGSVLESLLRADEQSIANLSYEKAIAYNANGDRILQKTGGRSEVNFTPTELARLENAVITHNHPSGQTLSDTDVRLAYQYNLESVRAVGKNAEGRTVIYEMRRPKGGWADRDVMNYALNRVDYDVYQTGMGKVTRGEWSPQRAADNHLPSMWRALSDQGYGIYTERILP